MILRFIFECLECWENLVFKSTGMTGTVSCFQSPEVWKIHAGEPDSNHSHGLLLILG